MSGDRNDHYTVLGVASTASAQEITHAFHRLVRRYHPDSGFDQPDDLRDVIAAYEVLRDPARRADYDRRHGTPRPVPIHAVHPAPPAASGAEPPIRVGPVRYHGPLPPLSAPTDRVVSLMREVLPDDWWWW